MRALLFAIGLTVFAQQQTARIEGRVADTEGKPVPRARFQKVFEKLP